MALGLYVSVPFCRSKCSFCNFASGVFSRDQMNAYMTRLREELTGAEALAESFAAEFERTVDSIYLGGGTPTTLAPDQLAGIFEVIRNEFDVLPAAEIRWSARLALCGLTFSRFCSEVARIGLAWARNRSSMPRSNP